MCACVCFYAVMCVCQAVLLCLCLMSAFMYVCAYVRVCVGDREKEKRPQEVMLSLYEETFSVHYPACRYN